MKTTGYTKLFSDILTSSVWQEPDHVRLVWITLLALCDADGCVRASVPGLANVARVELRECQEALNLLKESDEFSRRKENDGRRIEEVEGGWRVINFMWYRDRLSVEQRREQARIRKANQRARELEAKREANKGLTIREVIKKETGEDPRTLPGAGSE
jgi:hypothetical protein